VCLVGAAAFALAVWAVRRLGEPPKVEPPFEGLALEPAGPVKEFSLRDVRGAVHTMQEWSGRPGVVLFFIATECPVSNGYASEMARLVATYSPHGVLFLGIHSGPDVTAESAARHAERQGLDFPILLDPARTVAPAAGVRVTPEAVAVLPEGQIVYRGRIDDRYGPGGGPPAAATLSELEDAIRALVAGELPVVPRTRAFGSPLPPRLSASPAQARLTFARHVAPILWKNCARCHRPGEVAPFSLLTYKEAAKRAEFIRDVTASGAMPPWKPRPGVGAFLDDPRLTEHEIEILRVWAETGCAPGDLSELPSPPRFPRGWQLGEPDLVLSLPEPYSVPAGGPDIYRSFPVRFPLEGDVTINGVEFRPDNRRVVHHSRVYLDVSGEARRLDGRDAEQGFTGRFGAAGGLELPFPGLAAWTPGMTARFAPEGVGRVIPRSSDVVLQIHYHPTGKPETDRSCVGLFFARSPLTRSMVGFTLCTDQLDIPPGARRHKVILSARLKADVHLYTAVPHAHYLCREFRLAATLPDGRTQPLLWITDWDLDWQDQYRFARPIRLPRGTVLTLAAYYDNSDENPRNPHHPPRRVRYGVGINDEMCACHMEFLPDDARGYAAYPQKSPFGL
jgi:peroxiredoxin